MSHAIAGTSTGVELSDRDQRARQAVKAFRAMQPTLSAYARVLTKNPKVRVEMSSTSNGMTDGTKIYFRPPIELGDPVTHNRKLCDKRGDDHQLLCAACKAREAVLTVIYHEIAHICYDSFMPVTDADREDALKRAIAACGTKYAKKIEAFMRNPGVTGYNVIVRYISKYLPLMVNALEDARIEHKLFTARRGTRVMFDALVWRTFTEGFEGVVDGETVHRIWRDAPLDTQATIALYVKAAGYAYTDDWFNSAVIEALSDETIADLCGSVPTARTAADVYHIAFPLLARMRELGFFRDDYVPEDEEEPADEPEPDSGGDDSEGGDGEDHDDSGSDDDASSDSPDGSERDDSDSDSDEDGGDAEDDSSGPGTGSAESGDGGTDPSNDDEPDESGDGPSGEGEPSEGGEVDDGKNDESDASEEGTEDSPADAPGGAGSASDQDGSEDGSEDVPEGDRDEGTGDSADGSGPDESSERDGDSGSDPEAGGEPGGGSTSLDQGDGTDTEAGSVDDEGASGSSEGLPDSDDLGEGESGGDSDDRDSDLDEPAVSEGEADHPGDPGMGADGDLDDPSGVTGVPEPDGRPADEGGTSALGNGSGDGDAEVGEVNDVEHDGTLPVDRPESVDHEDGELIDTGADTGEGGVTDLSDPATGPVDEKDLPHGDPEAAKAALIKWLDHEEKPTSVNSERDDAAVDKAIIQGIYFERPSANIRGVREHRYGQPQIEDGFDFSQAWSSKSYYGYSGDETGRDGDFTPSETLMGPALLRTRRAFMDNARGAVARNLKSGKVNTTVLGKRIATGDPRLFRKRRNPGKKNYFAVIMMDVSGSTVGRNILIMKQAVMAQATLLHRAGIPFAIYAQSGQVHSLNALGRELDLEIYIIKEHGDPWDKNTQEALIQIGPDAANLDGHALEYARKRVEEVQATDRIILYYSDGKMPLENHDEELEILQREIRYCRSRGILLLGVGIRTDSPARHGLETVQLDSVEDTGKVVDQLGKYLARKNG